MYLQMVTAFSEWDVKRAQPELLQAITLRFFLLHHSMKIPLFYFPICPPELIHE